MLNKHDPEVRRLAELAIKYGHSVDLNDDRLRCIRIIMFGKGPMLKDIKSEYLAKCLSGLSVELTLSVLKALDIVEQRADESYVLTRDFADLVIELKPELMPA